MLPRKDLVDPRVEEQQSSLLIEQGLLHVELLQNIHIEGQVAAQSQALLYEVLHSQLRNLERDQYGAPTKVPIHTAT